MRRGYFTPPVLIILAVIIFAVSILIAINTDLVKRIKKEPPSTPPPPAATQQPSSSPDTSRELNGSTGTVDWKTYYGSKFSVQYPSNWKISGSVFDDDKGNKVAEFSPGHLTLISPISCNEFFHRIKNSGADIIAEETNVSFEGYQPEFIDEKEVEINGIKWRKLITKVGYEGGYPEWTGTWYPNDYCIAKEKRLFSMTFYEKESTPKNAKLYNQILSTFKFLE